MWEGLPLCRCNVDWRPCHEGLILRLGVHVQKTYKHKMFSQDKIITSCKSLLKKSEKRSLSTSRLRQNQRIPRSCWTQLHQLKWLKWRRLLSLRETDNTPEEPKSSAHWGRKLPGTKWLPGCFYPPCELMIGSLCWRVICYQRQTSGKRFVRARFMRFLFTAWHTPLFYPRDSDDIICSCKWRQNQKPGTA